MIKGRTLEANPIIAECLQEGNQLGTLIGIEIEATDVVVDTALGEVASAVVKIDDLFERGLSTVMKVRTGEFDIAQAGRLEGTGAEARIIADGRDAGAEEARIAD